MHDTKPEHNLLIQLIWQLLIQEDYVTIKPSDIHGLVLPDVIFRPYALATITKSLLTNRIHRVGISLKDICPHF